MSLCYNFKDFRKKNIERDFLETIQRFIAQYEGIDNIIIPIESTTKEDERKSKMTK